MTKINERPWRYIVNTGPTKGLIVDDTGETVLELANTLRSSSFEKTIQSIVRDHNRNLGKKKERP